MDYRYLKSRPEIRNNTLRFERDESGRLYLRPTVGDVSKKFYNFPEAQSHVRQFMGITKLQQFTAGSPVFDLHPLMRQAVQDITTLHPGAEFNMMSFNVQDASSVEQVRHLIESRGGWIVPDDTSAKLVQVRVGEGKWWSVNEYADFMHRRFGIDQQAIFSEQDGILESIRLPDKSFKRQKTLMNTKTFGMQHSEPVKVGVFDATSKMDMAAIRQRGMEAGYKGQQLEEWIRAAATVQADGYNEGSLGFFRKLHRSHKDYLTEIKGYLRQAQASGADDIQISRLLEEVKKAEKSVTKLNEIITNRSGTFYVQHMGGEAIAMDATGEIADVVRRVNADGIYFKGGLWLNPNLEDVDFRIHYENFNSEYVMSPSKIDAELLSRLGDRRIYGATSLTPKHATEAIIDVQTMSSYPEFMSRQLIEEGTEGLVRDIHEAVRLMSDPDPNVRKIPPQLKAIIESQLDSSDEMVRLTAQNILDFVERYPLSDDPHLMKRALEVLGESALRDKGRGLVHPKISLPDTMRGEIRPYWGYLESLEAGQVAEALEPGFVRSHMGPGGFRNWLIHDADFYAFGPAWGGPDYDDTVIGSIRYDVQNRRIVAPMTRQPQARGEWVLAQLYTDDSYVGEVIQKARKDDAYKHFVNLKKEIDGIVDDLSMRIDRAETAGSEQVAARLRPQLRNALKAQRSHEAKVHEILAETLRPASELEHPVTGRLPGRRGFEADAFVGNVPVKFTTVDGVNMMQYPGESPLMTYAAKVAPTDAAARTEVTRMLSEMTPDEQTEALRGVINRFTANVGPDSNTLGMWGNARMFTDHWIAWNEDTALKHGLRNYLPATLLEMEDVVDVAVQGVRRADLTPKIVSDMSNQWIAGVVKAAARGVSEGLDTRIDPALIRHKGSASVVSKALSEINAELIAENKSPVTLDSVKLGMTDRTSLLMDPSDIRATWSALLQGTETIQTEVSDLLSRVDYPAEILDLESVRHSKQATADAKKLLKSYKNAEARQRVMAVIGDMDAITSPEKWGPFIEGATGMTLGQYSRSLQDEFLAAVLDTFDVTEGGRIAGDRTHAALARAMQMISESEFERTNIVGAALSRIGMYADVLDWATDADSMSYRPASAIFDQLESLTRGPELTMALDDILRTTDISTDMLDLITRGVDVSGYESPIQLPQSVLDALESRSGARVLPEGGVLRGPLDPSMVIKPRQKGVLPETLGEMLYKYNQTTHKGTKERVARNVREALLGFQSVMEDWAADDDMPDRLRDYVIRSMERKPGQPGADDVLKGERARAAGRRAAQATESKEMSRGFMNMFRELSETRGGRGIMAGVAAVGAIGVIDMARRRDRTINEMQGPAFLPGGNPYVDDPNAHGSSIPMEMQTMPPEYSPPSQAGGVTYQVRTRGGNYDDDFVNEVQNITGGNVTGTIYDDSAPFKSANVREQILRMYG